MIVQVHGGAPKKRSSCPIPAVQGTGIRAMQHGESALIISVHKLDEQEERNSIYGVAGDALLTERELFMCASRSGC